LEHLEHLQQAAKYHSRNKGIKDSLRAKHEPPRSDSVAEAERATRATIMCYKRRNKMYDFEQFSNDELKVLAKYILPRKLTNEDTLENLIEDLKIFSCKQLRGTIGCMTGNFYNDYFRSSPYWNVITYHFKKIDICPICKKIKQLVVYSASYDNLGVNHLHPEDHYLACGSCHSMLYQMSKDTRFWRKQRRQTEKRIQSFIEKLVEVKSGNDYQGQ
jgi:hypothetical protein